MARSAKTPATITAIAAGTPIHHDKLAFRHVHRIINATNGPSSDSSNGSVDVASRRQQQRPLAVADGLTHYLRISHVAFDASTDRD